MIAPLPLAFIIVLQESTRKTPKEICSPEVLALPFGKLPLVFLPHQSFALCPSELGPVLDTEKAQEFSTWETDKINYGKVVNR